MNLITFKGVEYSCKTLYVLINYSPYYSSLLSKQWLENLTCEIVSIMDL